MRPKFTTLSLIAACTSVFALGCASQQAHVEEDEEYCKSVKPGEITTVNSMCAVMIDHPVDPSVEPAVWKGKRVGFCCDGCRPRWDGMTAAQKDAALAKATPRSPR